MDNQQLPQIPDNHPMLLVALQRLADNRELAANEQWARLQGFAPVGILQVVEARFFNQIAENGDLIDPAILAQEELDRIERENPPANNRVIQQQQDIMRIAAEHDPALGLLNAEVPPIVPQGQDMVARVNAEGFPPRIAPRQQAERVPAPIARNPRAPNPLDQERGGQQERR